MTPREQQLCRDWDTRRDAWDKLAVGWHPVYDTRATLRDCAASLVGTLGLGLGAGLLLGLTTTDPVKVGLATTAVMVACVSAYRQHPRLRDPLPARPQLDAETLHALGSRIDETRRYWASPRYNVYTMQEVAPRDRHGRFLTTHEQAVVTAHAERNPAEQHGDAADWPF